jgi:hypothetical protein
MHTLYDTYEMRLLYRDRIIHVSGDPNLRAYIYTHNIGSCQKKLNFEAHKSRYIVLESRSSPIKITAPCSRVLMDKVFHIEEMTLFLLASMCA